MAYIFTKADEAPPTEYATPAAHPTIPGADWYIEGHRYRETGRTPTENGYTMTLERADIEPPYSFVDLEES